MLHYFVRSRQYLQEGGGRIRSTPWEPDKVRCRRAGSTQQRSLCTPDFTAGGQALPAGLPEKAPSTSHAGRLG